MKITRLTAKFPVVALFIAGVAGSGSGIAASLPSHQIVENYGKLPLSFEPNRGQTDAQVQFISHGTGFTIFLSPASATFALRRTAGSAVIRMDLSGAETKASMQPEEKLPGIANYLTGRDNRTGPARSPTQVPTYARARVPGVYPGIDLVYYGAQGQLEYDFVLAPGADPSRIHLGFSGDTPVIDPSGDLVLPLADLRFHHPVLYQRIRGTRQPVDGRFTLAANHEVSFEVGLYDHTRELIIDPVLSYSSYLGGSSQQSIINAMAVNAAGQIYVTGVTNALDYPTTAGVTQPKCPAAETGGTKCGPSSSSAAFVSKISADGKSLVYSTYLGGSGSGSGVGGAAVGAGGSGSDFGTGIAVDASDNAWVVGQTNSNNFPVTPDAYSLYCEPAQINSGAILVMTKGNGCGAPGPSGYNYSGSYSLFLVSLNPTGTSELYGTFLGGTNGEGAAQIALDVAGDIYVAGTAFTNVPGTYANTSYYNYPTTASAFQAQALAGGIYSAFVTEFAPGGHSLIYSTMFGGPNENTFGSALAIAAGKIFIGGSTVDPHLPVTPGALSRTCSSAPTAAGANTICQGGNSSGWVAEFDPTKSGNASLVFATYLNGSAAGQSSAVTGMAADAAGNVTVAGNDGYPDFPATPGVLQPTCVHNVGAPCDSGFVTRLSASGTLVWSTFYGSPSAASGVQNVSAIALDANDNVYITANSTGLGDYPLKNSLENYNGGSAYVTELSSDGSQVLFGSFYGGAYNVFPTGIATDARGSIYLAGYTAGGLPLVNAYQGTDGGGYNEGFFAKISYPLPAPVAFVSAASGQPGPAAAGSILSGYGTDLATGIASATTLPVPTILAGTTVTVLDSKGVSTPAPLFFASSGQVNFLVPSNVATGSASITVASADGNESAGTVAIVPVAPGLFVLNSAGLAAANVLTVQANGVLVTGNDFQIVNGTIVALPINLGPPAQQVYLVLYGTGIANRSSIANVTVSVGGLSLPVAFAGAEGEAGLDQINVLLPASLTGLGNTTITVSVDGSVSNTASVTIM
jgi:uncharacterized protein (TIGR03437 family)